MEQGAQPPGLVRRLRAASKKMLPRGLVVQRLSPRANSSVLLTFDDGPHAAVTPAVLDRLDAHGAKAVFFVIGRRARRAPHLLAEILKRGHSLGNHSHLHRADYIVPSAHSPGPCFYFHDLQRCQRTIGRYAGVQPRLFRPPGGRLGPFTLLAPKFLGLKHVSWSVEVADWKFRTSQEARRGAETLLQRIEPGDIVLLHDDNPCVLDLLDVLLPGLRARQFELASGIDRL
jgi:peptidoglycan/xylan/chitin deacetylase (PgdA/CDA1 family)